MEEQVPEIMLTGRKADESNGL